MDIYRLVLFAASFICGILLCIFIYFHNKYTKSKIYCSLFDWHKPEFKDNPNGTVSRICTRCHRDITYLDECDD